MGIVDENDYVAANVIAHHLGVSRHTMRQWVRNREFPAPIKVDGKKYYSQSKVDAWKAKHWADE